jgi:hypothetical protein
MAASMAGESVDSSVQLSAGRTADKKVGLMAELTAEKSDVRMVGMLDKMKAGQLVVCLAFQMAELLEKKMAALTVVRLDDTMDLQKAA